MDGARFDALAKTLAATRSRRSVVRGLAAGIAGGLLAATGQHQAGAHVCRPAGATCLKDAQCCSGDCGLVTHRCRVTSAAHCGSSSECIYPAVCCNGLCNGDVQCCANTDCVEGLSGCLGKCVAINDCCSTADCPPGQFCSGGSCIPNNTPRLF